MAHCKEHGAQSTCVECGIPQLARNNYFTGKLMVERDFTDEQRYFIGKDRRHNQQLHGWGTVCGLKVRQHPNEACQGQYVIIEPGTAIDCCGREIVVQREEYFDFRAVVEKMLMPPNGEEGEEPDDDPHTLQICIRYKECPTEDVPALFDECGCDDTACLPNRVLEGYQFDVIVDPLPKPKDPIGVRLEWLGSINVAQATRLALDDDNDRLYILKSDAPAAVYSASTINNKLLAPQAFNDCEGLDIAVSPDGQALYIALKDANEADPQIYVLDTADLSAAPINILSIAGGGAGQIRLAVASDGRLYAVNPVNDETLVWATDINNPNPPAAATSVAVGTNPVDIAIARTGEYAYVANLDSADVSAIKMSDLSVSSMPIAASKPSAIAASVTTAGENIAVVDTDDEKVYLIGWRPDEVVPADRVKPLGDPVDTLAHRPIAVAASSGGTWLYILEREDADNIGYVQPVNAHRVELKLAESVAEAVAVGEEPGDLALAFDHRRIYVADEGNGADDMGDVAILDVFEEPCADIFERVLDDCPACDKDDCVVLATIEDYVFGEKVIDGEAQAGQAQIDNFTGRRLLPSTTIITEVLKCLLEHGTGAGGGGEQGPPGQSGTSVQSADAETVDPPALAEATFDPNTGNIHFKIPRGADGADGDDGTDGVSVKSADAETVASNVPASAAFDPNTGNIHLKIPRGQKGDPGDPGTGLRLDLPHIVDINWPHAGEITRPRGGTSPDLDRIEKDGLIIVFDREMLPETLDTHTVQLLTRRNEEDGTFCYCNVRGSVEPVNVIAAEGDNKCGMKIKEIAASPPCTGVRFRPERKWPNGEFWVIVKGDFVLGGKEIELPDGRKVNPALDGDHLGPGLPKRCPTGNDTEGGDFESWFAIQDRRVDFGRILNTANVHELVESGIPEEVASAIVSHRNQHGPFESIDDLAHVPGVGRATLKKLRELMGDQ